MMPDDWEWHISTNGQQHRERVALLREISYEATDLLTNEDAVDRGPVELQSAKALSLNISSGGMLLLMENAPKVERVVRVQVPTPVSQARTPTLVEVRWVRNVPLNRRNGLAFVGVKFIF